MGCSVCVCGVLCRAGVLLGDWVVVPYVWRVAVLCVGLGCAVCLGCC